METISSSKTSQQIDSTALLPDTTHVLEGSCYENWQIVSANGANDYQAGGPLFAAGFNAPSLILAPNGFVGIDATAQPGYPLAVGSAYCDGNTWHNSSDRALKENFSPVNPLDVLEKVVAMPISEWNYKKEKEEKHLGPAAQDFHAAFQLDGSDDKSISTVDEGGVALAAIQGLNEKLTQELERRDKENAELKRE